MNFKPINLFVFSLLLLSFNAEAQNFWTKSGTSRATDASIKTNKSQIFELDLEGFKEVVKKAPMRFSDKAKAKNVILEFPNPDGGYASYSIVEAPTMSEGLSAKYPSIKSYAGLNIDNPSDYIRFDISPRGLHAMVLSAHGSTQYINPLNGNTTSVYQCFYKKDAIGQSAFNCETDAEPKRHADHEHHDHKSVDLNTNFRTYRLALACTGEYANFHGGDTTLVLAAMNTTMTRVNGVYEREFALTMEIIDNNDELIYLVPSQDPYTNNSGGAMLGQNQNTVDATIGFNNYDIGHVFSTGGGGIASLASVCTGSKARGVTGGGSPVGDPFDIDYVAHEMGHQFGANHTQNNNCNRVNSAAFEPGSATTIMGYAGICPPNVQSNSDDHFHIHSVYEIQNHITGTGNCAESENVANDAPVIEPLEDYTIPKSTPFVLTAIATDAQQDSMTYCWEQYDNDIATMPPSPNSNAGPAFRSLSPSNSNQRYMPALNYVVTNTNNTWEVLSDVERSYVFKVSVRDNYPLAGQLSDETMGVEVTGSAGPFVVSTPSAANLDWPALSIQTIEWLVANTDQAPVNASHVDIYLSTDGGYNYPYIIAENVPNTGSYNGLIPDQQTTTARIMVKGHDNIFYDISNNNFTISPPQEGFLVTVDNPSVDACAGDVINFDFQSFSFENFDTPINFDLLVNDPEYDFSFESNPLVPGESNSLSLFTEDNGSSELISWTGNVNTTADLFDGSVELFATIYPNSISSPELISPVNGATEVNPEVVLNWQLQDVATFYTVEIATDQAFTSIIYTFDNAVNSSTLEVNGVLETETEYFWRVTPNNPCTVGQVSEQYSFTTSDINCVSFSANDLPVNIPGNEATEVSSVMNIQSAGTIIDVNVTNIDITHTWVEDIQLTLISPSGEFVSLLNSTCSQEDDINLSFDDQADNEYNSWPCPPIDGLTYQPLEPLSVLNGSNPQGDWTLVVTDVFAEDGGELLNWNLDICYAGSLPIFIDGAISNVSCFGGEDGSIDLSIENGSGNYSILWSTNETTNSISNLSSGTYQVTVTDGGTPFVQSFFVPEPTPVNVFETITPTVSGQNQGAIDLNTIGGTAPYQYLWNDGSTDEDRTDLEGGFYTVTVTDANGCEAEFGYLVASLTQPVADFTATATEGCVPFTVQYTNTSTGDISDFVWIFEGGTPSSSTQANPIVTYTEPGAYSVTLEVSNELLSNEIVADDFIIADDIPTADFNVVNTGNYVFDFENNSENAASYLWDFGNGQSSTEENPSAQFEFPGAYNVTLIASNACGEDSISIDLITTAVNELPDSYTLEVNPNPSDGNFVLSWESPKNLETIQWSLLNTLGQTIESNEIQSASKSGNKQYNFNVLPAGMYYLKIKVEDGTKVFRLIID